MRANLSRRRIFVARAIAVAADLVQVGLPVLFAEGFFSPFEVALDAVVATAMCLLLGWHVAFLPTFLVEQLPLVDIAPSWTLAVLFATRGRSPEKDDEIVTTTTTRVVPIEPLEDRWRS